MKGLHQIKTTTTTTIYNIKYIIYLCDIQVYIEKIHGVFMDIGYYIGYILWRNVSVDV